MNNPSKKKIIEIVISDWLLKEVILRIEKSGLPKPINTTHSTNDDQTMIINLA